MMEQSRKYNILLLTDSRGWHKPKGSKHLIYGEKLRQDDRLGIQAYYCPFKWTTTLDLLEILRGLGAGNFQKVILHAGIVDHSPRRQSSAVNDLYDLKEGKGFDPNSKIEPGIQEEKIKNNKKKLFDGIFGEESMGIHLNTPFETIYEGEKTVNMYSLEMMQEYLVPVLSGIENLFVINSNPIVKGWNGDYPRKRPSNISLVEDYSAALARNLNCLNLLQWDAKDVQKFTCDNMHLTAGGSDWIYERICEEIELKPRNFLVWKKSYSQGRGMFLGRLPKERKSTLDNLVWISPSLSQRNHGESLPVNWLRPSSDTWRARMILKGEKRIYCVWWKGFCSSKIT